jgi:hypothetical protein
MQQFGTERAGFAIEAEAASSVVKVRAWGFWDAALATAFGPEVRDACRNRPTGTLLEMDLTELKPMREEGQVSLATLLSALPGLGVAKVTISTRSHLTKLQVLRLVSEQDRSALVEVT